MNSLVLLIICVAILAAGYICYGGWLCKQWGVGESKTETPAHTMEDGVDYVPAKAPVLMGHHFSSIAGAGPITGPIGAAMFGWLPVTLWILVGGIFFGGVHDFGALFASVRNKGQSIGEIISANMSKRAKQLFIIFSYLTLILVVAAFASIVASTFGAVYDESGALDMAKSATPATVAMISLLFILIAIVFGFCVYRRNMPMGIASVVGVLAIILIMAVGMNFHPLYLSTKTWMWIVGIYIAVASVTPVWILLQPRDYLSSFLLYAMLAVAAFGVIVAHPTFDSSFPAFSGFAVDNGNGMQYLFPVLFTTVACGAISGFHSTQSPLMARCMKSEKQGHFVFYGAMVAEGVIALIWAAAGCAVYEATGGLSTGLSEILANGQSAAIYDVCIKTMGSVGVALAMIGVIVCPITSGDTAFRSARLVLADWFKIDQNQIQKRLMLCVPLLAVGAFVGHLDYAIVWRYFSWTNQTLAMIVLWTASMYLFREKKNYWITAVPATFMSAVSMTYFFCASECLNQSTTIAYPAGIILAAVFLGIFIHATKKPMKAAA